MATIGSGGLSTTRGVSTRCQHVVPRFCNTCKRNSSPVGFFRGHLGQPNAASLLTGVSGLAALPNHRGAVEFLFDFLLCFSRFSPDLAFTKHGTAALSAP